MHTLDYQLKGRHHMLHAPTVWNEVTFPQLRMWMSCILSKIPDEMKMKMAVQIFYGFKLPHFKQLPEPQTVQVGATLRFLYRQNCLNKWLLPSFKVFFTPYYGPADRLTNITAYEFFNVLEPLYTKFKQKQDVNTLNALCAALYRPKRSIKRHGIIFDDVREPFTDAGTAKRARLFGKRLKHCTKMAIFFNYEGCRNFITATHKKVFKKSEGASGDGQGDVTLVVAGGPLGTLNETRNTNLYTFLKHLTSLIEQEEKLKAL